ncbi:MAG: beta-galactosidase [Chloroflexi bacterium]|nr:MAG: hypothetical protein UZ13_00813 [Chloroflexi bacterium OLB13]MBC6955206.1 hypothetical protein [Chloroflexota bacterium]MBV6435104.1 hypothetical protein [Anaerolineae bacterium]MDL1914493.1 hypothetical protein [Anaerolineae bacterium CFX4]OQY85922.1 MAG: hypothetical protein B6D42_02375 [Anaerolineae bacterium UTCFX5]
MSRTPVIKHQVRGFVLTWSMLTFIIAGLTFFGIYLTYTPTSAAETALENVAFPTATDPAAAAPATDLPAPTHTTPPQPTDEPEPTTPPTAESAQATPVVIAQAQAASPEPLPTLTPTVSPIDIDTFELGIQVQVPPSNSQDEMDGWMNDVDQKLQMDWVKIQVGWEYTEPVPGDYDFRFLRTALRATDKTGTRVLLSIVDAPDWAREPDADLTRKGPPADYQSYVNFVSELVTRFGHRFHAIEVWNEQNLDREWTSVRGLRAEDYVEMLRQTYQAVKQINPNIIVVSGALSTTGGCTNAAGEVCAIDDFAYFDAMIQAGLLNYADCIGAHHNGYNLNPLERWDSVTDDPSATFRGPFDNPHHSWSFRSTLEYYATRVQAAGGTQKLCITEFGWASGEDLEGVPAGWDYAVDNTLQEQRDWTLQALDLMVEMGTVRFAILWNLNYGPQAGWAPDNDNVPYSIVGPDFVHRPVFDALGEWSREYKGIQ